MESIGFQEIYALVELARRAPKSEAERLWLLALEQKLESARVQAAKNQEQ